MRLWPETISGQMIAIVVGAIVVVSVTGDFTEAALKRQRDGIMDINDYALAVSVASRTLATFSPEQRPNELAHWSAAGVDARLLASDDLDAMTDPDLSWLGRLLTDLPDSLPPGFELVEVGGEPALVYAVGSGQSLLFEDLPTYFLDTEAVYYLIALIALIAGFSTLSIRGIGAPARRMAEAMKGTDRFLSGGHPVKAEGPRELRDLAHALNDMRDRIRHLLDARGAMLRGVSHDLRTPLTRLRLRVERIDDPSLRAQALRDVAQMDAMIGTTLDYLRDGDTPLVFERCDLASILATLCDDFADTGGQIAYEGPRHLVIDASIPELTRAVANLCDNGLKFGSEVVVHAEADRTNASIHIFDNGPGIAPDQRDKVLQPYVKLDASRGDGGFGLGLSIAAEIVARHGGSLRLQGRHPSGLHAEIRLPRHQAPSG